MDEKKEKKKEPKRDIAELVKGITVEETKMLKPLKHKRKIDWVIRRYGTGNEKKAATRGEYPHWAENVVNGLNM